MIGCTFIASQMHINSFNLSFSIKQGFAKFYRRHYESISKFNVGLKTLLREGLSEPEGLQF